VTYAWLSGSQPTILGPQTLLPHIPTPPGHAVQTYTTLFLNEPACTDKIISDTHDAYVAFLKTQPGIVPDSVVVTITCTDLVS
jgi:hypothetical protein